MTSHVAQFRNGFGKFWLLTFKICKWSQGCWPWSLWTFAQMLGRPDWNPQQKTADFSTECLWCCFCTTSIVCWNVQANNGPWAQKRFGAHCRFGVTPKVGLWVFVVTTCMKNVTLHAGRVNEINWWWEITHLLLDATKTDLPHRWLARALAGINVWWSVHLEPMVRLLQCEPMAWHWSPHSLLLRGKFQTLALKSNLIQWRASKSHLNSAPLSVTLWWRDSKLSKIMSHFNLVFWILFQNSPPIWQDGQTPLETLHWFKRTPNICSDLTIPPIRSDFQTLFCTLTLNKRGILLQSQLQSDVARRFKI